MQQEPPQFIDPMRLARQEARLAGRLQISDLPRLSRAVADSEGGIEYELEFGRDSLGIHCIIGSIDAAVTVRCQRCLQPMPVRLQGRISLGIVQGEEEAKRLPSEYEPLQLQGEPLRLAELVEDEAILLLPIAPLHDEDECSAEIMTTAGEKKAPEGGDTHRPFADLDKLTRGK